MNTCHCGSEKSFEECCLPVIRGERVAATAEELMRSRYSAFVSSEIDWIVESHHPDTVNEVKREEIQDWADQSEWLGLRIRKVKDGGEDDNEGIVVFRARYRVQGQVIDHVEDARFERLDGKWYFHSVVEDDDAPQLVPVTARATVGRNDPCPCGSGKKFKRCCA